MAVAPSPSSSAEASQASFGRKLWETLRYYRRRARVRRLGHVRFRLTREGVHFTGILAFIFIGAVIREISLLILLAGAMIGLLILQWRFNTSTLVGLNVRRKLPRSTQVDRATEVEVRLTNPKAWLSAWLVRSDDRVRKVLPQPARIQELGTALADAVRPKGVSDCRYRLRFFERGEYVIGPTTLSTRFPLGLGLGWRTVDNRSKIIVHPKHGELTAKAKLLLHLDQHGQSKSSSNSGNQEGEFFGLRPWASGDSKRWIHWRTTARLGQLSVRQFEQQQQNQLTLVLDLHETDGPSLQEAQEQAISFVATFASKSVAFGKDKLAVGIAGQHCKVFPSVSSAVLVESLLDELAVAQSTSESSLFNCLRGLSIPIFTNPKLLIISTRANMISELKQQCTDPLTERLLAVTRIRWIDVSAGDLEPYFQWT